MCIGNTCRSIMAEYILKNYSTGHIKVQSCGIDVTSNQVNPKTIDLLQRKLGVNIKKHQPKQVNLYEIPVNSLIIALDTTVVDYFKNNQAISNEVILWEIEDPYGENMEIYEQVFSELRDKVLEFKSSYTFSE